MNRQCWNAGVFDDRKSKSADGFHILGVAGTGVERVAQFDW
jgi:hypothetical protein